MASPAPAHDPVQPIMYSGPSVVERLDKLIREATHQTAVPLKRLLPRLRDTITRLQQDPKMTFFNEQTFQAWTSAALSGKPNNFDELNILVHHAHLLAKRYAWVSLIATMLLLVSASTLVFVLIPSFVAAAIAGSTASTIGFAAIIFANILLPVLAAIIAYQHFTPTFITLFKTLKVTLVSIQQKFTGNSQSANFRRDHFKRLWGDNNDLQRASATLSDATNETDVSMGERSSGSDAPEPGAEPENKASPQKKSPAQRAMLLKKLDGYAREAAQNEAVFINYTRKAFEEFFSHDDTPEEIACEINTLLNTTQLNSVVLKTSVADTLAHRFELKNENLRVFLFARLVAQSQKLVLPPKTSPEKPLQRRASLSRAELAVEMADSLSLSGKPTTVRRATEAGYFGAATKPRRPSVTELPSSPQALATALSKPGISNPIPHIKAYAKTFIDNATPKSNAEHIAIFLCHLAQTLAYQYPGDEPGDKLFTIGTFYCSKKPKFVPVDAYMNLLATIGIEAIETALAGKASRLVTKESRSRKI